MPKPRKIIIITLLVIFLIIWFYSIPASLKSNYLEDFSHDSGISIQENIITLTNVRDWRYLDQEILSKNLIDRQINLDSLEKVWFVVEPFGKWDGIAHTFFIFDFTNQDPISFSIEARREIGEEYSPILGMLNQYELGYFWGQETDFLIRRATYLDHDLYMYPLQISNQSAKKLLITLAHETNKINQKPKYYNTLTSNCTNTLANIVNQIEPGIVPWHPARLLTGYADDYLYSLGLIPTDEDFVSITSRHYVTDLVKTHASSDTFSNDFRMALYEQIQR